MREAGLEPARVSPPASKAGASAGSATLATAVYAGRGRVIAPGPRSVNTGATVFGEAAGSEGVAPPYRRRLVPRVDRDEPRGVAGLPEADQHFSRGANAHELHVLAAAVGESAEQVERVVVGRGAAQPVEAAPVAVGHPDAPVERIASDRADRLAGEPGGLVREETAEGVEVPEPQVAGAHVDAAVGHRGDA